MTTDGPRVADDPHTLDAFADAWAAVFIDVYEKLKERGELPEDDDAPQTTKLASGHGDREHTN
jgi:hypothetical protein